jgi:hypothetical protein
MGSTTFFGNRGRALALEPKSAATVTLTNNSTTFTCTGAGAGDYIWCTASGQQYAARVAQSGTALAYVYKGPSVVAQPGFYSDTTSFQVLRGLEVNINWEVQPLYGTDSIARVDEAKYQLSIESTTKYCKWNPDPTVDWTMAILRPTGASGVVEDTNTAFLTGVVYYIPGTDGTVMEIVMGDVYFEGLPYPFPENDFIIRELKGKARSATFNSY